MPRLPDVSQLGARPVPINRRGFAERDTTAEGRGIAQLGQVIGQVGGQLVEDYQKRDDEQKVLEFRRQIVEWDRVNVHDPESGAVAKRGRDAFDLPKTLPTAFDKFVSEAKQGLTNARQRQIADGMALGRREQIGNWANSHALQQLEVFEAGEYKANILAAKDNATLYPALAPGEIANMAAATRSYLGKRAGPDAVAATIKADASEVHARVIQSLVKAGNVAAAEEHFKTYGADMNARGREAAQTDLSEVGMRRKVQAFEDDVLARGIPAAEAIQEARTKFSDDPMAREAAVSQMKVLYSGVAALAAQEAQRVSTEAWSAVMESGSMRGIPVATMTALRKTAPEEERQMRDWLEAKWRRAKADAEGKSKTDMNVWVGLREMAWNEPAQFAQLDPRKWQPYLSDSDFRNMVDMQHRVSKGDAKEMESQATIKRAIAATNNAIQAAGIDLTPGDNQAKIKKLNEFTGALAAALDAATTNKGKPLTEEEAKRISMGMLREQVEQGSGLFGFGQTKKRGYQIPAEEAGKFVATPYDKIPKAVRDEIEAHIRKRNGLPFVSLFSTIKHREEVERVYGRAVQAGVVK